MESTDDIIKNQESLLLKEYVESEILFKEIQRLSSANNMGDSRGSFSLDSPKNTSLNYNIEGGVLIFKDFNFYLNIFEKFSIINFSYDLLVKKLIFVNCSFETDILLCVNFSLELTECFSDKNVCFSLDGFAGYHEKVSMFNCTFGELRFVGNDNVVRELSIGGRCSGRYWEFYDVTGLSELKINNLSLREDVEVVLHNLNFLKGSSIEIIESNLRNLHLLDLDLSQLKRFVISGSNLSEIIFNNVRWSLDSIKVKQEKNIRRRVEVNDSKSQENRRLSEVFRQLKYASEKQESKIQALKFQAAEHYYYYESLSFNNIDDFGDKLILLFSKYSSNFGLSWVFPMIWILSISLLVTIFLYISLSNVGVVFEELNGLWLDSLRPTAWSYYDFKSISKGNHDEFIKLSWWVTVIWLVWKLIYFSLIFQLVKAFRKFNR